MNNDNNTLTLDLDFAFEAPDTFEGALAALLERAPAGVNAEVLDMHGPGGGWPLVRFTLPSEALEAFADAYGCEADELVW